MEKLTSAGSCRMGAQCQGPGKLQDVGREGEGRGPTQPERFSGNAIPALCPERQVGAHPAKSLGRLFPLVGSPE